MIEPIFDNASLSLYHIEKQAILNRISHFQGNKDEAAKSLGISIRTIYNKLEEYEKEGPTPKELEDARKQSEADWLARQRGSVKTLENMTQAEVAANPNETYGLMSHPKPVAAPSTTPTTPAPVVPKPAVRLPSSKVAKKTKVG